MRITRTPLVLAAAFGLAVSAAPGIAAAGQTPMIVAQSQSQTPSQTPSQTSFSDEKLQAFASAAVAVRDIRQDHAEKIEGVKDEEQHAEIVDETIQKMTSAVEEEPGITVEEYNQINQASQQDQQLAQKIQGYLQEAE